MEKTKKIVYNKITKNNNYQGENRMDNRPIGIFDSGVGGITVLKEIKKKLPKENIIYLGDTKNFPYGNKTKEEIIQFSIENVNKLLKYDVKLIVIACGTATSQSIDILKEKFSIPIIGIIEPTIKYVKQKDYKKVGVIATEGTIKNGAWEKKLKAEIPEIEVINKACPMLATIAEEGKAKRKEGRTVIKEYMKIFKKKKIDKIILGCTHFPVYEDVIKEELGYEVELINTGNTVSEELKEFLEKNQMINENTKGITKIYLTKKEKQFEKIAENILKNS